MKSKRKPCKGDIWEWHDVTVPAKYLFLEKADVGNGWWIVLELDSGDQCEVFFDNTEWKFIS